MPNALDIIDVKLERAYEHITQLSLEADTFLATAPYLSISDGDPNELQEFQKMLAGLTVPPRVSILAGEAIHQCRSALDHIASALVRLNKGTVTNQTQFPIFSRRPTKKEQLDHFENCVRGMTASARELIEQLQPFEGADVDDHPLTILKRLNNRDKHQALLVAVAACRPFVLFDIDGTRVSETPDDFSEWMSTPFTNVERRFAAYVVFPKFGTAQNRPVVEAVSRLWAYVTFTVSRRFRAELTTLSSEETAS